MEQQAWILRNLLAQLEKQQEALDEEEQSGIAEEFTRLKNQSTQYRNDKTYPTKSAQRPDNFKKNRYKDIVPFDHSRVKLTFTTSKNDTDYINASFIKGVSGSRAYIATQGPLPHTVLDFLRMLWEYEVEVVVMACREFEMGKKKCERYWPQGEEESFVCKPFIVYCDSEENKGDYLTRMLRVTYHNRSRTMKQLHYVNWPDHGVPDSIPPILAMLQEMRSYQSHDDVPFCIHCSAGCGRTGALCVIDYTWNLLKKQMIPSHFSIYDLVQNMRTQRPSIVQTKEQYDLVYRTIKLLFERYLESMEAPSSKDEVAMGSSANTADDADVYLSEVDLQAEFRHLPDTKSVFLQTPLPPTSVNLTASSNGDEQREHQQCATTTLDLQQGPCDPEVTRASLHTNQRASTLEEEVQENKSIPHLQPAQDVTTICLMVEDPYFDTPLSSPSSEEACMSTNDHAVSQGTGGDAFGTPVLLLNDQTLDLSFRATSTNEDHTDKDIPPPLPARTPESYELAVDEECRQHCERLTIIHPPNTAAETVTELEGSPPSPVPPLPERTPESFELVINEAPAEQSLKVTPAVNLNKIGTSSEWFGNSKQTETPSPFTRSKSLRTKFTFTAAGGHRDFTPNPTSDLCTYCPPLEPQTPPLIQQERPASHSNMSLTPPLPDRTPQALILTTDQALTTHPSPRIGISSEWDGTAQPKTFPDVMTRSKSVRVKTFREERLSAAQQLVPPPVVTAAGGCARVGQPDVNHAEASGHKTDKNKEKGMSRAKSLKFFRHKFKLKPAPPLPPSETESRPPSYSSSFSVFKLGFGNRFGKPKGPRDYPDTWV